MNENIKEVNKNLKISVYISNILSIFATLAFLGVFIILFFINYTNDVTVAVIFGTYWWLLVGFVLSVFMLYVTYWWNSYMGHYIQLRNSSTEVFRTMAFDKLRKDYFFVNKYAFGRWLTSKIDFIEEGKKHLSLFTKEQQEWLTKKN